MFVGLFGVGYPVEVLDVDETAAEEDCSENLGVLETPPSCILSRLEHVRAVLPPRPDPSLRTRWNAAAAARRVVQGRRSEPKLALVTFPRRMLNAPALSADDAPIASPNI